MGLNDYRFQSRWKVRGDRSTIFDLLHRIDLYPRWWPEVKTVERVDDEHAAVTIRAALPYSLRFVMTETVADAGAGVLEVQMTGDLDGRSRWVISQTAKAVELRFTEEVELMKPGLRRVAFVARPLFQLNHAIMMRRGRRGLSRYLASGRFTAELADVHTAKDQKGRE